MERNNRLQAATFEDIKVIFPIFGPKDQLIKIYLLRVFGHEKSIELITKFAINGLHRVIYVLKFEYTYFTKCLTKLLDIRLIRRALQIINT